MSFDVYMEKEIPGYKDLLTEKQINDLKSQYEQIQVWTKTRDHTNSRIGKGDIDFLNDFKKADRTLERVTGNFYISLENLKQQLNIGDEVKSGASHK